MVGVDKFEFTNEKNKDPGLVLNIQIFDRCDTKVHVITLKSEHNKFG